MAMSERRATTATPTAPPAPTPTRPVSWGIERAASSSEGDTIRKHAVQLDGAASAYDELIKEAATAQVVLIGDGSHGTHDFYRQRALITRLVGCWRITGSHSLTTVSSSTVRDDMQRLIEEHGFRAVAWEADWPDAYQINRFVRRVDDEIQTATESLAGFKRFPTWMWRNADVLDFAGWLREYNTFLKEAAKRSSTTVVLVIVLLIFYRMKPLERSNGAHKENRERYGLAASLGDANCEKQVWKILNDLLKNKDKLLNASTSDKNELADDYFYTVQNAQVVADAEKYYKSMFLGQDQSWNVRDTHMMTILGALIKYLNSKRAGRDPTKVVVWAHKSHLGDARATDMSKFPR
eukprot:jgi/Chlat1/5923/Chrsp4S06254